ncbi:MAG: glycoside hydrolase family 16 protein [Clostridiales bacterium]|nr:glycoside hydrolase family 16 protein [Clostridiales bacterium]
MKNLFSLFSARQVNAFHSVLPAVAGFFKALFSFDFKRAAAMITAVFQLFGAFLFDTPVTPYKDRIDMSRFELVWSDEFDHGFDTKIWQGHYVYGNNDTQKRDYCWWNRDSVSFTDDGCLQINVEYKEDGPKGAGYYTYGMETNPNKNYAGDHEGYEQLYGYFEISCILPKGSGINPAFWLLTDGMWADDTDGGVSGAEIDILETNTRYNTKSPDFNSIVQTIHVDAYGEAHKHENQGFYYADNPYEKFNTYGVEWNSEEYIFYVNGVETARTSFGGVCQVPLYLIISVGVDELIENNEFLPTPFTVDYVRCYQYK